LNHKDLTDDDNCSKHRHYSLAVKERINEGKIQQTGIMRAKEPNPTNIFTREGISEFYFPFIFS